MKGLRILLFLITAACISVSVSMILYVGIGYKKGQDLYRTYENRYVSDVVSETVPEDASEAIPEAISGAVLEVVTEAEETGRRIGESREEKTSGHNDQRRETSKDDQNMLPENAPNRKKINFTELLKQNEEVVGWIDIPAVSISYPVVQGKNNEYYLHRSVTKEYLFAGSIFMDSQCSTNYADYHTILYGHNMRDRSMFTAIKELCDQKITDSCPYFWIYHLKGDYLYRIFSVYQTVEGSNSYQIRFQDNETKLDWQRMAKSNSLIKSDETLDENSRVVTLSTCTGNGNSRWVVMGKLVWKSES